jgi:hypothetical protein
MLLFKTLAHPFSLRSVGRPFAGGGLHIAIEKQFQQFAWYKPHPERSIEQIEDSFSDQEKKNIDLLRQLMDSKSKTH